MKIRYTTGDLVRSSELYMAHGCNAQGRMGKGIAKQVHEDYPEAYEVYRAAFLEGNMHVGEIIPVACKHPEFGDKTIINAITQDTYWKPGEPQRQFVSYEGVRNCVNLMDQLAMTTQRDPEIAAMLNGPVERIGFPKIGCGLAGGDWEIVAKIIEEESSNFSPIVYLFD